MTCHFDKGYALKHKRNRLGFAGDENGSALSFVSRKITEHDNGAGSSGYPPFGIHGYANLVFLIKIECLVHVK